MQGDTGAKISGVSIDSRKAARGDVFIAIKGKNFDGHNFIKQVSGKSVAAVVVSKKNMIVKKDVTVIYVADTTKALGMIARFYRDKFKIPVIAITGSAGKTTAKEMIAAVLETQYRVLKNIATENNHIGVPMTLLRLNKSHQAVVVELGTNHFGEIRWLTTIANPTVAVMMNIGESHLEFFKNLAGVFKEKSQLVKNMEGHGVVVFNNDDKFLQKIKTVGAKHRLISFGLNTPSYFSASGIEVNSHRRLQFSINKDVPATLNTTAAHNVYNALAAVSCARLLKISYKNIAQVLEKFSFPKGRQLSYKVGKYNVIDDSYNANPVSFRGAVTSLGNLRTAGQKIIICGDMLELGAQSIRLHQSIGELIAGNNIDLVISVGKLSKYITQTAKHMNQWLQVYHCATIEKAYKRLRKFLQSGDTILIKGSRGMHMERMIDLLKRKG